VGTSSSSWAERVSQAETRLNVCLPDQWADFVPQAPDGWPIEFIMPEDLATLQDAAFDGLLEEEISGEARSRIIPFAGDGAGNFFAFRVGESGEIGTIIDLDHEAGTGATSWPGFEEWRLWAEDAFED
jgi:SMI1/KNR4 family protein SUKH-1